MKGVMLDIAMYSWDSESWGSTMLQLCCCRTNIKAIFVRFSPIFGEIGGKPRE
jgi:hypothetical protein